MVSNHNRRLWKIQIQKQLSAGLVLAKNVKHSVEWTPKPTHLPTTLILRDDLLNVRKNAIDRR